MKKVVVVAIIAFAITLAVIIGQRMSTDAMAVVIGIACGVLASIPTSLLILAVTNRHSKQEARPPQRRDYPPVVVVNPGGGQQQRYLPPLPTASMSASQGREFRERQFHIIGDEDVVLDEGRYF
jgi:hypothetical protein